jgi:hypothetical protein
VCLLSGRQVSQHTTIDHAELMQFAIYVVVLICRCVYRYFQVPLRLCAARYVLTQQPTHTQVLALCRMQIHYVVTLRYFLIAAATLGGVSALSTGGHHLCLGSSQGPLFAAAPRQRC